MELPLTEEQKRLKSLIKQEISKKKKKKAQNKDNLLKKSKKSEFLSYCKKSHIIHPKHTKVITDTRKSSMRVEEKIINKDRRKTILEPTKFPNSPTGLIKMTFGEENYFGTGVLIYPMIVLTAAHNVYDNKKKIHATEVTFSPGESYKIAKFGVYKVLKYFFPEVYKTQAQKKEKEDYAILLLDRGTMKHCPGYYTGSFGLKVVEDISSIINGVISINGYPFEMKGNEVWGMDLKVKDGRFRIKEGGFAMYDIDTTFGQSGSGIVLKIGKDYFVVGVHVRGGVGDSNEGTIITRKRFGVIHAWVVDGLLEYKEMFFKELKDLFGIDLDREEEVFDLSFFGLGDYGVEVFAKIAVEDLPYCSRLDLSDNGIGDKGIEYLMEIQFDCIKYLDLKNNSIGDKGIEFLSKMKNKSLLFLDLSNNKIGIEGIRNLRNMNLKNLEKLFLKGNNIGDEGKKILSEIGKKYEKLKIYI